MIKSRHKTKFKLIDLLKMPKWCAWAWPWKTRWSRSGSAGPWRMRGKPQDHDGRCQPEAEPQALMLPVAAAGRQDTHVSLSQTSVTGRSADVRKLTYQTSVSD